MRVVVGETPDAQSYRCWVNDAEVTQRCYAADEEQGWAGLFQLDERGKHFIANGEVARETVYGLVRLERRAL